MLITCENASFGYDGRAVIKALSFSVEHSDYLWVVGENGAGKTTLIRGFLRLLNPLKGNITFCEGLSRGKIGYLSQQPELKKDFPADVFEVVLSGNLGSMGLRPIYTAKEKARAATAMERLGIIDLKKEFYRELSGGQQQRVLLARAFCAAQVDLSGDNGDASHRLLVLDEPAAGLDPLITAELYDLLKKLNHEIGISIIMVSHDIRGIGQYAKHILHIENSYGVLTETAAYINSEKGRKFLGLENEGAPGEAKK